MAGIFNEYFTSVFNKNVSTLFPNSISKNEILNLDTDATIVFSQEMISDIIKGLKMNKSPGVDGITSTYILKIRDMILDPLVHIYNRSFKFNEIPLDWKRANITPIFKKEVRNLLKIIDQ